MNNKLRVILDTNVLMVSILPKHKYYWIYESLILGKYDLLISNEMLTEYSEILDRKYGIKQADITLDFLTWLPNVDFILPTFNWNLIEADADDTNLLIVPFMEVPISLLHTINIMIFCRIFHSLL